MSDLQRVASEAVKWFETVKRGEGDDAPNYVRLRDGAPGWIGELVYAAHRDMMPADWRYARIADAINAAAEGALGLSDPDFDDTNASEWADSQVDIYTSDLLDWLASSTGRPAYVDEAVELGMSADDDGIIGQIKLGQFCELEEIASSVLESLQAKVTNDSLRPRGCEV